MVKINDVWQMKKEKKNVRIHIEVETIGWDELAHVRVVWSDELVWSDKDRAGHDDDTIRVGWDCGEAICIHRTSAAVSEFLRHKESKRRRTIRTIPEK